MILLVLFLALTTPAGQDIFISPDSVGAIIAPLACSKDSHAELILTSGSHICVAEGVYDVRKKLENGH